MRISDWSSDVCSSDLDRIDITLLILPDPFGIGGAGRVQRGILRHLTGNALIGRRAGEVETSLDVGRNPVSDIEIAAYGIRSEERSVGKECVSTCSYRWSPYD